MPEHCRVASFGASAASFAFTEARAALEPSWQSLSGHYAAGIEHIDGVTTRRADNASLSTGELSFTVAAWVYLDSLPAASQLAIMSKDGGGANREYLAVILEGPRRDVLRQGCPTS